MSRKSVIQLVSAPISRGNASDLRYRLLMAALGASEDANPLLIVSEGDDNPEEALETAAVSADHAEPMISPGEHAVEHVVEHKDQATSANFEPPPELSAPQRKTATGAPTATGGTPVPRASKRR